MKSKLSDLASIAEIIAAVGVILSLIFVGLQIGEGNKETRAATVQAALDSEMLFQAKALRYADTWEKIVIGAPLSDGEEKRKGILLFNMSMTMAENRFHQINSGYIQNEVVIAGGLLDFPFYEIWRNSAGADARSLEFIEYLDSAREQILAE